MNPANEKEWTRAKKLCRLNNETLRMAKEMGLNPRSLTKNIPNKSQPWKAPVHVWIRDMYEERQEKSAARRRKAAGAHPQTPHTVAGPPAGPAAESNFEAAEVAKDHLFDSGDEGPLTGSPLPQKPPF